MRPVFLTALERRLSEIPASSREPHQEIKSYFMIALIRVLEKKSTNQSRRTTPTPISSG
jgi:hypothetical protein